MTRITSAIVAAAALATYTVTAYPTVAGGDSGEFVLSAWAGGAAHPPGYPLLMLIGKLAISVLGSPAWAMNVLSGVFDATAAGLIVMTVAEWTGQAWAGGLAGGLFAFSPLVWRYSVCAEVFPLNNLFVALLLFLSVRYALTRERRWIGWIALAAGLGLSNHHTLIFCVVPLAAWLAWYAGSKELRRFGLAKALGLFVLGLMPYLYLPLAASAQPVFSWGHLTSVKGFLGHLLRRDYGTFQLGSSEWGGRTAFLERLWHYLADVPAETLWLGAPLALVGAGAALWTWSRKRARNPGSVILWTLGAFVLDRLVFNLLSNGRLDLPLHLGVATRFWLQPDVIVFVWLGLGFARLFPVESKSPGFYRASVAGFVVVVVALQFGLQLQESDQHENRVFHDWGVAILNSLEPNAFLILTDDVSWSGTSYAQLIEGIRPDVRIVNHELLTYWWEPDVTRARYPDFGLPGRYYLAGKEIGKLPLVFDPENYDLSGAYSLRELIRSQYGKHPVYILGNFKNEEGPLVAKEFDRVNAGLVDRLITPEDLKRAEMREWIPKAEKSMALFDPTPVARSPEDSWEHFLYDVWAFQRSQLNSLEKRATSPSP